MIGRTVARYRITAKLQRWCARPPAEIFRDGKSLGHRVPFRDSGSLYYVSCG
jgi:hypothetical protein